MISSKDKNRIIEIAKKYNVFKLYLFGIADSLFFKFYGEIIFSLSKPVDLIDLKKNLY